MSPPRRPRAPGTAVIISPTLREGGGHDLRPRHGVRRLGLSGAADRPPPGGRGCCRARRGAASRARSVPHRDRRRGRDHRRLRRCLGRGVGRPGGGRRRGRGQHRRPLCRARAGELRRDPRAGRHAGRPRRGAGRRPAAGPHLRHRGRSGIGLALCPRPRHRRAPGQGGLSRGHHPPPRRPVRAGGRVPQPAGGPRARHAGTAAVRQRCHEAAAGLCARRRRSGGASAGHARGAGPSLRARRAADLHLRGARAPGAGANRAQTAAGPEFLSPSGSSWPPSWRPCRAGPSHATR